MDILKEISGRVKEQFAKEYACHLVFVHKVAVELQQRYGGDLEVIEIAAMAHDIGRVEDGDNSMHPEIGATKIIPWLQEFAYENEEAKSLIARCILMHNKVDGFQGIEEEIISNADGLSKLLYHDMFMLMCRKDNYLDKAKWGLKYIEKGYSKLTLPGLREEYKGLYEGLKGRYEGVLKV